jgi:hypothetical protein
MAGMSYFPCSHKADNDHSRRGNDGVVYWACSCCGLVEAWSEEWRYWGNIECRQCQAAAIDYVACSDWCWDRLHGTKTLRGPKGKP